MYTYKHVYAYIYKYTVMRTEVVASMHMHEHISTERPVYICTCMYKSIAVHPDARWTGSSVEEVYDLALSKKENGKNDRDVRRGA